MVFHMCLANAVKKKISKNPKSKSCTLPLIKKAYGLVFNKMSIRIIEKGGTKIKSILTKPDPFPQTKCDVKDCPFRTPTPLLKVNKEQNCRMHNVGYRISCDSCNMTYEGESHRMISVRASEHVRDLRKGAKNSPLYKHRISQHPNEGCNFKIQVTGHFFLCTLTPSR